MQNLDVILNYKKERIPLTFVLLIIVLVFIFLHSFIFKNNNIMKILIPLATFIGGYGWGKCLQNNSIFLKAFKINSHLSMNYKFNTIFGQNCSLDAITPDKIEDFKTHLKSYRTIDKIKINNTEYRKNGCRRKYIYKEITKEKNRSNATINRHIELLSKMFNLCIENNLIKSNPCRTVKQLREENFKIRFLTPEEERALFKAIETPCKNKEGVEIFPYIHLKPLVICTLITRRS